MSGLQKRCLVVFNSSKNRENGLLKRFVSWFLYHLMKNIAFTQSKLIHLLQTIEFWTTAVEITLPINVFWSRGFSFVDYNMNHVQDYYYSDIFVNSMKYKKVQCFSENKDLFTYITVYRDRSHWICYNFKWFERSYNLSDQLCNICKLKWYTSKY